MATQDIGLIGLAVMGQNLVLNMANSGFSVAVYNRTREKTEAFAGGPAAGKAIEAAYTIEQFVKALVRPRRIILMVKAGAPVDHFISQLQPHLDKGDVIIDAGNSFFGDTDRRCASLDKVGIHFIGMGVSGGEEGALKGPSIMPGGSREAYGIIEPIVTAIAAQVGGQACCTYIGPRGAGHYVKMVHNGIEYGIMQLICEGYDFLKTGLGLPPEQLAKIFRDWNAGHLDSYLMEITAKILAKTDPETGGPLVELILDRAQQKGTGKWTSQNALDLGVPIPTINAAVEARILSALKSEREKISRKLTGPEPSIGEDQQEWIAALGDALEAAMIISYAQGLALIKAASKEYDYDIRVDEVARIWRGGCIIRSTLLEPIRAAYELDPQLLNLMVSPHFAGALQRLQGPLRKIVSRASANGLPCLALGASLGYYDMYRRERLPANLLQAQRDFFGAHTYQRVDQAGVFHTAWDEDS